MALGLIVWAAYAQAQTQLSAKDAVTYALAHRPEVQAAADRATAAQQLRAQAGLIPNPRIYLQSEDLRASNFDFGQQSETYAYASETLETSGRRGGRMAVAGEAAKSVQIAGAQVRSQIALKVRQAYAAVQASQLMQKLYAQDDEYFKQIIAYHQARFHEGKLAEVDLLRVRIEGARVHAAAARAELDAERAAIELNREMGAAEDASWTLADDFETLEPPAAMPAGADPTLLRPEGQAAQQAMAQAAANVRLQKALGRPDMDFLAGYKRDTGLNTAYAGLQFNLPLFDRNQKAAAAAQTDTHAAAEDFAAVRHELSAEAKLAERDYEFERDEYEKTFKPLKDEAVEDSNITRAAYQEGGMDLVRLLDAERVRVDAEVEWAQALESYHQSVAALEYAEGIEP
jgi:outer membrane protein TolC